MPYRSTPLVNGQFYHVFNRGVEKRNIFTDRREYRHFLETIIYYQQVSPPIKFSRVTERMLQSNSGKLVEILAYCLMPNHFHLLLKQLKDNGISTFIRKIADSFTRYFNTKNERIGPLLQGPFKAVRIENDEQLIHVSRYIHLNPLIGFLVKDLEQYEWSSYPEYIGLQNTKLWAKEHILTLFPSPPAYKQFVMDQVDYAKKLDEVKHLLIE